MICNNFCNNCNNSSKNSKVFSNYADITTKVICNKISILLHTVKIGVNNLKGIVMTDLNIQHLGLGKISKTDLEKQFANDSRLDKILLNRD